MYRAMLHFTGDWLLQSAVFLSVVALDIICRTIISRLTHKYAPLNENDVL
jgi:hypothetical protein